MALDLISGNFAPKTLVIYEYKFIISVHRVPNALALVFSIAIPDKFFLEKSRT